MVEGTATSGAAGVAEAGNKPESTLAYSTTDEPVKKIATTLTISDEMLEDGGSTIQSYLKVDGSGQVTGAVDFSGEKPVVITTALGGAWHRSRRRVRPGDDAGHPVRAHRGGQ